MPGDVKIDLAGIGGLVSGVGSAAKDIRAAITGKSVIDPTAQAELEMKALDLANKAQEIENTLLLSQIEVNKAEAASGDKFASRWRPMVGWISTIAFAWIAILSPLMQWIAVVVFKYAGTFPAIDSNLTLTVLGGLLGLGTLRTVEYVKGVMTK